jgi:hypothetical protein
MLYTGRPLTRGPSCRRRLGASCHLRPRSEPLQNISTERSSACRFLNSILDCPRSPSVLGHTYRRTARSSERARVSGGSMSYSGHHRSQGDARSPEARGSGVRASRDPRAAASGRATTSTHTPDRHHAACLPGPGQTPTTLPDIRPALASGTLLVCLTSSPSPAEVTTRVRPDNAQAWRHAPTPLTPARSGGCATTRLAGTAAVARTSSAHTGHGACNSVPASRRAGPHGYGGVSVAVPDVSQPDPGPHYDGLFDQRFIARDRCR